jgi:Glycosyltransferase family 87
LFEAVALSSADSHGLAINPESSNEGRWRPLPKVLRWFWIGSAGFFGLAVLISILDFRAGMDRYRWIPFDTPYFMDLLDNIHTFPLLHTEAFFHAPEPVAYPPFGAMQLMLLYSSGHPVRVFLVVALAALSLAVWGVRRALIEKGISPRTATLFPLTLVLVSFPIERLVIQGNVEIFLWIFASAGTWAYLRDRNDAAGIFWGLAAACKLFPVVLLVLLLPRRKFRAFAIGLLVFVGASALSTMYLGPTMAVAWNGSLHNVFGYQQLRAAELSIRELHANHSSFLLVKFVAAMAGIPALALVKPYYVCGGLLFAAIFFGRLRRMPVANQLLGVSLFMLMLPTISYFHTLVNLYAPLLVLFFVAIRAERVGVTIPGLSTTILLFVPLFASFQVFTFPSAFLFCGMVQAVLLLILFLHTVQYPFVEPVAGDSTLASG